MRRLFVFGNIICKKKRFKIQGAPQTLNLNL